MLGIGEAATNGREMGPVALPVSFQLESGKIRKTPVRKRILCKSA